MQLFTHDSFTVVTTPITHSLCGPISYTATFDSQAVDATTLPPVAYDETTRSFEIYSEDLSLIGLRDIEVSASLTNFGVIVTAAPETT